MAPTTLVAVNPDERFENSPISVTRPLKLTLKDSMVAVFAVDLSAILFVY